MAYDIRTPDDSSLEELVAKLDNHLRSYQADPFTDRTRTNQNILLALAFVLLVLAKGYVVVDSTVKVDPFEVVVRDAPTLMLLLSALCLFYMITYAARAYTDWALSAIDHESAAAILDDADFLHHGGEKPFSETRTALAAERRRRWNEGRTAEEQAALDAARRKHESHQALTASKRRWLRRYFGRARRVVRLRLFLEILFPLTFSSYALYCAITVLLALQATHPGQ